MRGALIPRYSCPEGGCWPLQVLLAPEGRSAAAINAAAAATVAVKGADADAEPSSAPAPAQQQPGALIFLLLTLCPLLRHVYSALVI